MNSNRTLALLLAVALPVSSATSLRAEDWKTTDGKVYQNVTVIDSAPDAVTILHQDGGALVPLANLPPDIQKRFNYDPVKAKAAADARARDDAANASALQAEMNQASQMRQAAPDAQDPGAPETDSSPANDAEAPPTTPASSKTTHYSIGDIASSMHSLQSDPSDSNHHSISDLADSIHSLRRDLSEPDYHTMAHLAASMRSLKSDSSDSTHHSISEIADSGL
jgi:type II secretory pathway pseudopilin PulG